MNLSAEKLDKNSAPIEVTPLQLKHRTESRGAIGIQWYFQVAFDLRLHPRRFHDPEFQPDS